MRRWLHSSRPTAVRTVDLSQPLTALTDVQSYARTRVFVMVEGRLLGSVPIANQCQPIRADRLRDAIVDGLGWKLLQGLLTKHFTTGAPEPPSLSFDVSASIVVATRDRPDDLRTCLRSLTAQASHRRVEIVVVDNNPQSGLAPAVVAQFPGVVAVNEPRMGLSYARNAGIMASTGDIVVTTDDDVTMPPDWLETLIAPFAQPDVMVVTGNVLPLELETPAQHLFEAYGGLGRGFNALVADKSWFEQFRFRAVPTWILGGTANAAFRSAIFSHSQIGLLDEALGAGTPTGCSEDTYLFYKALRAGFKLVYEPNAYVWHKHRRDMQSLRQQIYNYSKGHVAYHLTTLDREHDWRAMLQLLVRLPQAHLCKIRRRLKGSSSYPLSLIGLEIMGNLAGPWALWKARRRAKRKGGPDGVSAIAAPRRLGESSVVND